jgi:hypothetical protein
VISRLENCGCKADVNLLGDLACALDVEPTVLVTPPGAPAPDDTTRLALALMMGGPRVAATLLMAKASGA